VCTQAERERHAPCTSPYLHTHLRTCARQRTWIALLITLGHTSLAGLALTLQTLFEGEAAHGECPPAAPTCATFCTARRAKGGRQGQSARLKGVDRKGCAWPEKAAGVERSTVCTGEKSTVCRGERNAVRVLTLTKARRGNIPKAATRTFPSPSPLTRNVIRRWSTTLCSCHTASPSGPSRAGQSRGAPPPPPPPLAPAVWVLCFWGGGGRADGAAGEGEGGVRGLGLREEQAGCPVGVRLVVLPGDARLAVQESADTGAACHCLLVHTTSPVSTCQNAGSRPRAPR